MKTTSSARIAGLLATTTTALLTLTATPASAAIDCDFVPGSPARATVTLTAPGDEALIAIDDFNYLSVNGDHCFDGGANAATFDNIDSIEVTDTSSGSTTVKIDKPARFAPGDTTELGSSEIELAIDLGTGSDDLLELTGHDGDIDRFVSGANGINVNPADTLPDVDIVATGHERQTLLGFGGADQLSAGGGANTGGPSPVGATIRGEDGTDSIQGSAGDDTLDGGADTDTISYDGATAGVTIDLAVPGPQATGGSGTDTLKDLERAVGSAHDDHLTAAPGAPTLVAGNAGNDTLVGSFHGDAIIGGPGNDLLDDGGSYGADIIDGETGIDTVTYSKAPATVRVNLGTPNLQNTSGAGQDMLTSIENLEGSSFDDELRGTPDENVITGLAGADLIDGSTGPDEFRVRDGEKDQVICGDGADTVTADRVGVDTLTGCETTDFAPEPTQPGNGQPGPGTGNPTPPPALDSSILLRVGGSKSQRALRNRYVTVTGICPAESCTLSARPVLKIARKGRKAAITRTLPAVQATLLPAVQRTLKVKLSKKNMATLRSAKRRGTKATITVAVTASDAAGNATTVNRKITLR